MASDEIKDSAPRNIFLRLAIANFIDNTNGVCEICKHKYVDVDEAIQRDVVAFDGMKIACKACVEKK